MKKLQYLAMIISLVLLSSQPAWSSAKSWEVDKAHSGLVFYVDHIFSKVFGQFKTFDADIAFDPDHLDESSVVITIQVDSIDTGIAKRDKHLLSADFFNAGKSPEMVFTSKSITKESDSLYSVTGALEVKGKSYPLTLPLQYLGPKDHPMMKGSLVAGFNIDLTLDRLAYGIGDGTFFEKGVVGKEVVVQLSVEALSK